jgi:molybdate transport system substrate-binding protein
MFKRLTLLLAMFLVGGGCSRPAIRVLAAASTSRALEQIAENYKSETGMTVQCEFAASSTLARQIEHGAQADFFLSADEEWADYLEQKGFVEQRRPLLENKLVIIVPSSANPSLKDLGDLAGDTVKRLAIGGETVPVGRYARHALERAGVWERVQKRLLEGKDVSAVYLYVARGEADAGFVYATDAAGSDKVRVAFEVPERLSGFIRYPLVTLRHQRPNPDAARFAEYLAGDSARAIFRRAGFELAR